MAVKKRIGRSVMKRKAQPLSKRDQLLQTALELFAREGFHATGVDRIVEESGVTKKTLYAHFGSKEDLIVAVLREYEGKFRAQFFEEVEEQAKTPKGRLLGLFDVAERWFSTSSFHGCLFINAIGEYSEPTTSIRSVCQEYKGFVKGYIQDLCEKLPVLHATHLAEELALLLEGATVTVQVSQNPKAAQIAKRIAKVLIDKAIQPSPSSAARLSRNRR